MLYKHSAPSLTHVVALLVKHKSTQFYSFSGKTFKSLSELRPIGIYFIILGT